MPDITVKKNDFMDRFSAIEVREPTVSDIVQAVTMCGKAYARFIPALLSIICTFDGKMLPLEDIQNIPVTGLVPILTELFSVLELDLTRLLDKLLVSLKLQDGPGSTSNSYHSGNSSSF